MLVSEIEMKQSKMDECQKYAEQYSTAVKVRRLVPCIRFHVQVFRGVFPQCSFEAFMGHSVLKSETENIHCHLLLILHGNLSHVTTPGSLLLSPCHTHAQLAHTPMYTRRKCSCHLPLSASLTPSFPYPFKYCWNTHH